MPAARYWRAVGLQAVGGVPLELSALHLYLSGARVDAAATLTSTVAPTTGSLSALQDDDTATKARWLDTSAPGFALVWDFGSGNTQDVGAMRLGSGALLSEFLERVTLQYSSDAATWTTIVNIPAFTWPGAGAMQSVPASGDADYSNVSLLLHCDGTNGSTTFTDNSPRPKTVTRYGGAVITTAQSKFGGACLSLDGVDEYLTTAAHADFVFGTGDFTIELWIKTTTSGEKVMVDQYSSLENSWQLSVYSGNLSWYRRVGGSGSRALTGGITVNDGNWHHVAAVRQSGVLKFFVDGVADGSASLPDDYYVLGIPLSIGAQGYQRNASYDYPGFMDDIRITKGVGRYAASFTPPSSAFPDYTFGGSFGTPSVNAILAVAPVVISGGQSAQAAAVLSYAAFARDMQDFGLYRIYGTVKKKATQAPLRRRVQLFIQRDSRLVRETWSDASTGAYSFDYIKGGPGALYFVCAFDHTNTDLAVIAEKLIPEAIHV